MNRNITALFFFCLFLFSCTGTKKTSTNNVVNQQTIEAAPVNEQDGTSFAKAIIIQETSSGPGIRAEYAWIRKHYPDSKVVMQQLHHEGKKSYDILTIENPNGEQQEVYFDITRFFGKPGMLRM